MLYLQKTIAFAMVSLVACNAMSSGFNEDALSDDENLRLAIERSLVFHDDDQGVYQNNDEVWQDASLFGYTENDEDENMKLALAMSMMSADGKLENNNLAFDRVDDEQITEKQIKKNEDVVDEDANPIEDDVNYNEYVRLLSSSVQKLMLEKNELILLYECEDLGFPAQIDGVLPEVNNQILQYKSLASYSPDELFQAFQDQFPRADENVLRTRADDIYNHFEQRERDILLRLEGIGVQLFDPSQNSGKQMAIEHFLTNNPEHAHLTQNYLGRVWDSFL